MSKETLIGIIMPLTGAGVLLFALMPLALPFLLLTIVATVPLLLVGLVVALVVGVIVAPVVVVRRLLISRDATRAASRPPADARRNARARASRAPRSWPARADHPGC